jgi:hypothetical protein
MVVEFGADMRVTVEDGVFDLDPTGALDTPARAVAMAVARRFVVERGALFYDPNYGLDLRGYLAKAMTPGELFALRSLVTAEAEKDERVQSADADVSFDPTTNALRVRIVCTSALGTFSLTLDVSSLSVELLDLAA